MGWLSWRSEVGGAPEWIRGTAIVVPLDVHRVLRCDGESAAACGIGGALRASAGGRNDGKVTHPCRAHTRIHQFQHVARTADWIGHAFLVVVACKERGSGRSRQRSDGGAGVIGGTVD